jgi:gamma-glutamylcysteine synthetase
VGYIEGRAPGAVFADSQLISEAGNMVAVSAPIAPSALQLGLINNLDEAERLWRDWGWQRLRGMRLDAIRYAMSNEAVHALALDTLAVARAGLPASERHWLAYAEYTAQARRTGADRLLSLWHDHAGQSDRLARVCAQRTVHAVDLPSQV